MLYVEFTKNKFFLSFHSPIFHSKTYKHLGTFFEREWGNSLKRTYVEGEGLHIKWTERNKEGGAGQKLEVSSDKF